MLFDTGEIADPHLTADEVQSLLGFVQRFHPIIAGGQAVNSAGAAITLKTLSETPARLASSSSRVRFGRGGSHTAA